MQTHLKLRDEVKLEVMEALKEPKSSFDLMLCFESRSEQISNAMVLQELGKLERAGYVKKVPSSTVAEHYAHANEHSMSDLRRKLLPYRDPVREAHEFEQTGKHSERYRGMHNQRADLDTES